MCKNLSSALAFLICFNLGLVAKKTLKNQSSRISTGTNTGELSFFYFVNLASTRTKIRTEFFICLLGAGRKTGNSGIYCMNLLHFFKLR